MSNIKQILPKLLKETQVQKTMSQEYFADHREYIGIFILRVVMASMWISEGLLKLFDRVPGDPVKDHHQFLLQLQSMAKSHPVPAIGSLINSLLVQNHAILVWVVIATELFIGISILFGIYTRIGSLVGMIMALNLWVITMGWGEWLFTYPFIFTPMLVIFISNSSQEIGLDRYLVKKDIDE